MIKFAAATVVTVVVVAFLAGTGGAAPGPPLKLDAKQLQTKTCGKGRLVVNVVQRVVGDVDSGTKGNYWAFDDYTRLIKVWRTGAGVFCAIVSYDGAFRTIEGASPGGTGSVPAGLEGRFEGGYRMDFTGTLRARPRAATRGSIGTFDYRCSASGDCPGATYWLSLYFTKVTGDDFDWWGWIYRAGRNGTWLNAVSGAKGDIVATKKDRGKGK